MNFLPPNFGAPYCGVWHERQDLPSTAFYDTILALQAYNWRTHKNSDFGQNGPILVSFPARERNNTGSDVLFRPISRLF